MYVWTAASLLAASAWSSTAFPSGVFTRTAIGLPQATPPPLYHNNVVGPWHRHRQTILASSTQKDGAEPPTQTEDFSTPEALVEEEMLKGPQQTFLVQVEKSAREKVWQRLNKAAKAQERAARSGGRGFGGAGKATAPEVEGEHEDFAPKVDKSRYGAVIVEQGVARINGRLSKETAAAVLEFVNQSLEEALNPTAVTDSQDLYAQQTRFADVLGKHNRWDMLMPLEESSAIMQALSELLLKDRVLSESIESILGPAPQLYELGSLISDPGSERQMLHADYNYQPDFQPKVPPALTCFVALQDVEASMGPTTFLSASATSMHHQELADRQDDALSLEGLFAESPNVLSTLGSGDCSIYNPMTLHCGGANRSAKRRCIFYFSFKNPKFNEKDWPLAYASLSPDLRARSLTLPDLHGILKDWNDSKVLSA
jgi:ectoine hydroxylase-related dioxygenase (phytanoyl-CoA dioxygenase family)